MIPDPIRHWNRGALIVCLALVGGCRTQLREDPPLAAGVTEAAFDGHLPPAPAARGFTVVDFARGRVLGFDGTGEALDAFLKTRWPGVTFAAVAPAAPL